VRFTVDLEFFFSKPYLSTANQAVKLRRKRSDKKIEFIFLQKTNDDAVGNML
jgi:hypothetical protein